MVDVPAPPDPVEEMWRCARRGLRVAVAVGRYRLIHAGTVRFLRAARARCDRLFVAVVPDEEGGGEVASAGDLLKLPERVKVLAALREVDGAGLLDASPDGRGVEGWRHASPESEWIVSGAESETDRALKASLERAGVRVETLDFREECTTGAVLRRMGKSATLKDSATDGRR